MVHVKQINNRLRDRYHTRGFAVSESGRVIHVQLIIFLWEKCVGRHSDSSINQLMLDGKTECPTAQLEAKGADVL